MTTTESRNKELAQRLHDEGWDEDNDTLIDELTAKDYIEHSNAHQEDVHGPAGFKREAEQLRAAFPDLAITAEDTIAEGDKVASRLTFRGTHEGTFQDLPPPENRSSSRSWPSIASRTGKSSRPGSRRT